MQDEFNLERYMTHGVENIVKRALKATLMNPQESIFMVKFASASKSAARKRKQAEEKGEHIPPFLIASITSKCNLHCVGCYSRANHSCVDSAPVSQLTKDEWSKIFGEAMELGISFILLAGGEPLLRRDVIEEAAHFREILFPIFTNGTMIDLDYLKLFQENRNLVPVLSIEGEQEQTDGRRGDGVYLQLLNAMATMRKHKVLFGASLTVTTANMVDVMSDSFLAKLKDNGCKVIFFIEFVPVTSEAKELAPGEEERTYMKNRLDIIRRDFDDIVFISFPGDEKSSGGCLAAGRGFFHINSHGGAEPCPFSPYSDVSVKDESLKDALESKLFRRLQDNDVLMEDHAGGCVLFERRELVEEFMRTDMTL